MARNWTLVPGDLGVAIDLPKLPKRLPKPLRAAELERVATQAAAAVDEPQLRDAALVAFLLSTGCRISEALQLDRADWNREQVIVRGKGDVERTAVITELARAAVERYLAVRPDDAPPLFLSYSNARRGRRLSVRGAEDVCARLGVAHRVTKLHPHRFRHTAGTIVQEELGDPRLTAEFLGHHSENGSRRPSSAFPPRVPLDAGPATRPRHQPPALGRTAESRPVTESPRRSCHVSRRNSLTADAELNASRACRVNAALGRFRPWPSPSSFRISARLWIVVTRARSARWAAWLPFALAGTDSALSFNEAATALYRSSRSSRLLYGTL